MQYFINHAAIEKAAAEALTGPRARYYIIGLISLACASVAGFAAATIWVGLALLVDITREALWSHAESLPDDQADAAALGLDVATSASLAVAPALAWYSNAPLAGAVALAMIAALTTSAAFAAKRGRLHTLIGCMPYASLGLVMTIETAGAGALPSMIGAALILGYLLAAALHHAKNAAHARMQDAEWIRQLNMSYGETSVAGWEIDFENNRIEGATALAAVLGRAVTYEDVVDRACFAPSQDRALVKAAFSPQRGAVRRVALEHAVVRPNGAAIRVRHQGFVRTTLDGVPTRMTCVTRITEAADAHHEALQAQASETLAVQRDTLRKLAGELSRPAEASPPTPVSLTGHVAALAHDAASVSHYVDDLVHLRHESESANMAKSQFLANMSHELRTPLNAIIGYGEMLQEEAEDRGDKQAAQDIDRILAASKHLLSLIGEILDLSKIEAGRMDAVAAAFDPVEIMQEIIETLRPAAEANGNTLQLNVVSCSHEALTDVTKLNQCVLNLLSNAVKFTKNGAIDITLEEKLHNGVRQLLISVADTGIGMSQEQLSRLFQPFVQADPTIAQKYGGSGLGLTITRRLTQLLGGDITVKSTLGEGSTFTLNLPVDLADAAVALGAAAKIDDVQGHEDAPLVLVIEDQADAREIAARSLTRLGFAVQGVGGGDAGLALARSKAPALILLDIFLPDRSGWRVLQSLKQDARTHEIPVIVFSVNEDRAQAMSLGAAEHVVKPADRDLLAATVLRYARTRPTADDAARASVSHKAAS